MNLTVKLTDVSRSVIMPPEGCPGSANLLVCDRCHDLDEIVVAIMQIEPIEERWALCGQCMQKLPKGFHLA